MQKIQILWTDDEIELLRPHILFLQEKGYEVFTASNGDDAIQLVKENYFDIIFLDENMPGISGLQVLAQIKKLFPSIPVVMVTKSEEEDIMEEAIGAKISDYLIKPVNPKQVLLSIKKNIDHKRLITEKTTSSYQTSFGQLGMKINSANSYDDWIVIYKDLIYWEVELDRAQDSNMDEVLKMQKNDANTAFGKFIKKNYSSWFQSSNEDMPLLSQNVFKEKVFPHFGKGRKNVLILIDNFRLDQWKTLQPLIRDNYKLADESVFCSILPTATQYSRNAMFAGLMPADIDKIFPGLWLNDDEEGGKNMHEEELIRLHLNRFGFRDKFIYKKINNLQAGQKLVENYKDLLNYDFSVIVYNFVDMLSHARTEMKMIKELAADESAYRSLTLSWFEHSPLYELFTLLSNEKINLFITTDHGAIRVNNPVKVVGEKNISTNLRYKQGRSLGFNPKDVFEISNPESVRLPKSNISSSYIFALGEDFFAYPNNFNHYAKYFKDTFQHGGVSMEEMLIPIIRLEPKQEKSS